MDQPRSLAASYPDAIKPSKLAHVVIRTARFDESKRWWGTVLDAAPSYENGQLSFMTYDDEHHRIGIINMPQLRDQDMANAGAEHISFAYDELGQLLATYRRLKGQGIAPFWTINHGPTISMYFRDPDGTKVELQYDVFDVEGTERFFATGAYEENFMGIIFDAEDMISQFEGGRPIEEITRRPKLPEGMTPWDMHRA